MSQSSLVFICYPTSYPTKFSFTCTSVSCNQPDQQRLTQECPCLSYRTASRLNWIAGKQSRVVIVKWLATRVKVDHIWEESQVVVFLRQIHVLQLRENLSYVTDMAGEDRPSGTIIVLFHHYWNLSYRLNANVRRRIFTSMKSVCLFQIINF